MSIRTTDLYEFGPYRVDPERRLFTRGQSSVPLAPKTFELLLLMVQHPGRAFSKQELMTALWPDTFVEEANLSFQISMLRKALGENGSRWIETVPRHGYRFNADVKMIPSATPAGSTAEAGARAVSVKSPLSNTTQWAAVLATAVVGVGLYATFFRQRPVETPRTVSAVAVPLTAYPGFEDAPSLSPDGSQVAFSWNGPGEDNFDIYVKLAGPGEPVRLTTNPARDGSPAWSPDGRWIAFERFISGTRVDVFIIPALGGAERKLTTDQHSSSELGSGPSATSHLSWTPDSKWLAFHVDPGASPEGPGIWMHAVDGSDKRRLTDGSDWAPTFSDDGRHLAFVRQTGKKGAIFVLPLSSVMTAAGAPSRLTPDAPALFRGLDWTPEGTGLVLSSAGHMGFSRLFRLELAPTRATPVGSPALLPFGEQGIAVSVSRTGRVVYSSQFRDTNVWKASLTEPVRRDGTPMFASTFDEHTPAYSPDGRRIAFASTRSGSEEMWVGNSDGSNLVQLTSMGGPLCANPQWSPDGQTILFNSRREGSSDLYLLRPDDGELRRLTDDPADELEARWSRDGRTIYFGSNRTGRYEIWKMPAAGGAATRVTRQGGLTGTESPDGRFLYYAKQPASPTSIWRVPVDGGEEQVIAEGLSYPSNVAVADNGLYFLAVGDAPHKTSIDFLEFATLKRKTLLNVGRQWWYGMALSPDQQSLLYSVVDSAGSNLMIVDNFQ